MDTTLTETIQNNNNINKSINNKKKLKHQKKKEQKKKQKQQKKEENIFQQTNNNNNNIKEEIKLENNDENNNDDNNDENNDDKIIAPVDGFSIDENDPSFELFSKLVKHFDNPYEDPKEIERKEQEEQEEKERKEREEEEERKKKEDNDDEDDDDDNDNNNDDNDGNGEDEDSKKLSNKERKRQRKLHLPILKQLVDRPDVVELHDVNSPNPGYLIAMKSYRNTIPVPAHWCQKKKYLQGKRGFVKPPFELPSFIAATGITKIREAILEKEKEMKSKQKQRERVQPKIRKMGIDYEVLRDAFFVHQTKPNLSIQGDLYYEGKEFEVNLKNKKPGVLSDELKRALGMIEGYPPPWLIYMQTYGPPPSYPNLKIPGVNSPIPEGAQYGFHPGGWGRPVLNEFGKPLYENVNNNNNNNNINSNNGDQQQQQQQSHQPTREYWGELLPESEDFQEEEEEQQEQQGTEEDELQQHQLEDDESIGDGISSVPSGLETPDIVNIKKSRYDQQQQQPRELYQVIEQQNKNSSTGGLMESAHRYNIPSVIKQQQQQQQQNSSRVDVIKSQRSAPVEITLNPSEVENGQEIDEELLKKKYEQATQALQKQRPKEDISDIIEEQNKKRKNQLQKEEKQKKFKF
ncbi:hypothetical protein ACTFIW_001885 [Dictyostelium discoideum]